MKNFERFADAMIDLAVALAIVVCTIILAVCFLHDTGIAFTGR